VENVLGLFGAGHHLGRARVTRWSAWWSRDDLIPVEHHHDGIDGTNDVLDVTTMFIER